MPPQANQTSNQQTNLTPMQQQQTPPQSQQPTHPSLMHSGNNFFLNFELVLRLNNFRSNNFKDLK